MNWIWYLNFGSLQLCVVWFLGNFHFFCRKIQFYWALTETLLSFCWDLTETLVLLRSCWDILNFNWDIADFTETLLRFCWTCKDFCCCWDIFDQLLSLCWTSDEPLLSLLKLLLNHCWVFAEPVKTFDVAEIFWQIIEPLLNI